MFVATLDGIFKYPDIPEEYEPYVQFKATIEKREVKDGDDLAILSIIPIPIKLINRLLPP